MHLFFIRHGQSIENTLKFDGSNKNSPLTELGLAQAAAVGRWFAKRIQEEHLVITSLYASPMRRSSQTAHAIAEACGLEVIFDDRLREVGNSRPDGTAFPDDALPRYFTSAWGSLVPYKPITEAGENWMHFRARVGGFLEWLIESLPAKHDDITYALVCHGGVIEGFYEHIFEKGPKSAVVVHTSNTGVCHLEYDPVPYRPAWNLYYHNSTRHLEEAGLTAAHKL